MTTVLIPLDGSKLAERALPYAMRLVRAGTDRLILVRAFEMYGTRLGEPDAAQVRRTEVLESETEPAATWLRGKGFQVDVCIYHDDAGNAILRAALDHWADVIVMSTHGRSGPGRWIYGSVADDVLRRADIPVLLVPARCEHVWPDDLPPRIVVALDGSELAEGALRAIQLLDGQSGGDTVLVRVVEPPAYPLYGEGYAYVPFDQDAEIAEAGRYLQVIVERVSQANRRTRSRVVVGQPAATVVSVAREEEADLIVMATHGRSGLARLALGSVATGTVQHATVPVLIIRPGRLGKMEARADAISLSLSVDEARAVLLALTASLAQPDLDDTTAAHLRAVSHKIRSAEAQGGDKA